MATNGLANVRWPALKLAHLAGWWPVFTPLVLAHGRAPTNSILTPFLLTVFFYKDKFLSFLMHNFT